ncbi:hypothetical protein ACOBQJ_13170 [Pelotomaculum propionicicum]|uniref:hypothetical protein n=1 Tax=Pelotomaculum propionicicum TaxID=258475 RepID=UPI003B7E715E
MALLFCDGFDHYTIGDMPTKYIDAGANSISSPGRNGTGYCVRFNNSRAYTAIGSKTTLVVGFGIKLYTAYSGILYRFCEGDTTHVDLRIDSSQRLYVTRNGTTLGSVSTVPLRINVWEHVQIKVFINDSTGTVEVKINSVSVISLTGQDTQNGLTGVITKAGLYCNTDCAFYDDYWIDDADFLGDCIIETKFPNGAGDTTEWTPSTGSNYACVDEVNQNGDTDYVSSGTAGQVDTYAFADLLTSAGSVKGVQANVWARKDDGGTRQIALVARPVSTDRVGASKDMALTYAYYRETFALNPETGAPWTIAEVNAAKFGVKLVS